ncbi:MAG: DUF192 domain-containing protein [Halodesulfurarchaeum sp.]
MAPRRLLVTAGLLSVLLVTASLLFGGAEVGVEPDESGGTPTVSAGGSPTTVVTSNGPAGTDHPPTETTPRPTASPTEYPATVQILAPNGSVKGTVRVRIADEPEEHYRGLSATESMPSDAGMLFVFEREATRTFVMREMDFPLDMLFIGADGRITRIYHAPVENDSDLTRYSGRAKWVLEVNRGWASAHNVSTGDRVDIQT